MLMYGKPYMSDQSPVNWIFFNNKIELSIR